MRRPFSVGVTLCAGNAGWVESSTMRRKPGLAPTRALPMPLLPMATDCLAMADVARGMSIARRAGLSSLSSLNLAMVLSAWISIKDEPLTIPCITGLAAATFGTDAAGIVLVVATAGPGFSTAGGASVTAGRSGGSGRSEEHTSE